MLALNCGRSSHTRRSSTNRNRSPLNEIGVLRCGLSRLIRSRVDRVSSDFDKQPLGSFVPDFRGMVERDS